MQGGWIRSGIAIDGGVEAEDTLVWWLQAPSKHCDLRVAYSGTEGLMSFAGTTTWAESRLTWTPEIALDPSIFEDIGVITWDGADMMEAGVYYEDGREVGYVERWKRLPGSEVDLLALSNDRGRIVRTGSYALSLVDERPHGGVFAAVAWTLSEDEWTVDHCWPADAVAPAPPLFIPDEGDSVVLADGTKWITDER
jgi:hypothetical protein